MDKVVYLLGDSITQGLGSKQINFTEQLECLLGNEWKTVNLACTGTTVEYALRLLDEGKININSAKEGYCVIIYGNVDAQIRPNSKGKVFPIIPRRFQGNGMLMPRPFYSHHLYKRIIQYVENMMRSLFRKLIVRIDGTEQWVQIDKFNREYEKLIVRLLSIGIKPIACSCVYIDERLFPGTQEQYMRFNETILKLASKYSLPYIDFYNNFTDLVRQNGWSAAYNRDHFHPNGKGYEVMAELIAANLSNNCI